MNNPQMSQEIDGENYIRPDMNILYQKPAQETIKKIVNIEEPNEYRYKPKRSIYQRMLNSSKQIFYSVRSNYYKAKTLSLKSAGDCIFINGERFDFIDDRDNSSSIKLMKRINRIVWFSYRRNWLPPIHGTSLTTDSGWGCMVRCGQMLYFEALRILHPKLPNEKWANYLRDMLLLFNEHISGALAPYSIQNIVPEAFDAFNIKPGEWFRSTSIMMTIERINKKFDPEIAKSLKMVTFVESIIYINKIYQLVCPKEETEEIKEDKGSVELKKEKSVGKEFPEEDKGINKMKKSSLEIKKTSPDSEEIKEDGPKTEETPFDEDELDQHIEESYIRPKLNLAHTTITSYQNEIGRSNERMEKMLQKIYKTKWKQSVLISVAARIGVNVPEDRFYGFLLELLSFKQCIGILGGQHDKAYYIVGFNPKKKKFYYLDPHYINESVKPKSKDIQSYLKKTVHEYNYKSMNCCLQISFLVRSGDDFKHFIERLQRKLTVYGMDNSFISLMETDAFDSGDEILTEF